MMNLSAADNEIYLVSKLTNIPFLIWTFHYFIHSFIILFISFQFYLNLMPTFILQNKNLLWKHNLLFQNIWLLILLTAADFITQLYEILSSSKNNSSLFWVVLSNSRLFWAQKTISSLMKNKQIMQGMCGGHRLLFWNGPPISCKIALAVVGLRAVQFCLLIWE